MQIEQKNNQAAIKTAREALVKSAPGIAERARVKLGSAARQGTVAGLGN